MRVPFWKSVEMTSAQVLGTSVTNNNSFQKFSHLDDHTIRASEGQDTQGNKTHGEFLVTETETGLVLKALTHEATCRAETCRLAASSSGVAPWSYGARFTFWD